METILVIIYFFTLSFLSLHGLHIPWLIYQRLRHKPFPLGQPFSINALNLPVVTIQLPIFNEIAVVEILLKNIIALNYPKDRLQIQVLDDSTDATTTITRRLVEQYQQSGFRIELLHREDREGYKAGALQQGLLHVDGEYIAIFDADFIPPKDFLLMVLPLFDDPRTGMVQTRWGHRNPEESWLTQLQGLFLDAHFVMETETRDRAGLFLNFNGTSGIWRKECILDSGGWEANTLTEDLDLSYRAQLRGWHCRYLNDCVSIAELPKEINAFKSQQYRWTRGAVETLCKLGPQIIWSRVNRQIKLEAMFHLSNHLIFPLLLILAICAYPALTTRATAPAWQLLVIDLPLYLLGVFAVNLFYVWGQWILYPGDYRRCLHVPGLICIGTGLAISNTLAVLDGYFGKPGEFVRTPKRGSAHRSPYSAPCSYSAWMEILLTIYLLGCMFHALFAQRYATIPFLLVFALGFGWIGGSSILENWKHTRQ
jgi:cellulose synthase/poly-beta-1,6-N-acetylglucosamine synthase-like glycosyltransferase